MIKVLFIIYINAIMIYQRKYFFINAKRGDKMLILQILAALSILLLGRFFFFSFVRKDPLYVFILRYGGFIGITVLSHYYLGNFWTWAWIIGLPLLGLLVHFIFVRIKGFHFLKPGEKYDNYSGWK